ncbi:MAG: DUF47 domain-containing protein [Elusimicrobia bacterium]|nr:DUF47 domain-containing protein [Elusimicrobiota bacterium]
MAFSLIPKEEKFYELFTVQADAGVKAAAMFQDLVRNWDLESPLFDQLRDLEHEADITTHEIKDKLNRTFVTPFDREDIHALASELDDIVDIIQSISNRMRLYRISSCRPELAELVHVLAEASVAVQKAVSCFSSADKSRRVLDHCIEVNRLENEGDALLAKAIGNLFAGDTEPMEALKWDRCFEAVERGIDKCEEVAHTIEGILAKQG